MADESAHGTRKLETEIIQKMPIPVPPIREQRTIVDFLDRETARIDRLVERKRRLITRLDEKRSALISRTVTRGLPPEAARAAGLDPHPKLMASGIEWLGEVPDHWQLKRLKHVAEIRQGITKGRDLAKRDTVELPYLRVANVQDGYVDLSELAMIEILPDELERYRLRAGDVLMNEGGDNDKLGRGAVWHGEVEPCLHQNHVFSVRPSDPKLSGWIALWTQGAAAKTFFLLHGKQTTNLASISSSNLREMPLLLPPQAEREAVIYFVGRETKRIGAMMAKADAAIDRLLEYRTALITAAVTGKIDVRGESAGRPAPAPRPEPARLEA